MDKYSPKTIQKIRRSPSPKILLNACTHGSERVGLQILKHFSKLKINNGTLITNIANERAVKSKKRFIECDLNRAFPGKKEGAHEERLAYNMKPFIDAFDVVIDIHSTESGVSSTLIITKFSSQTKKILEVIGPKRVLYMNTRPKTAHSLISSAKIGIAFEYGKDRSTGTLNETIRGVTSLLEHYGMTKLKPARRPTKKIEYFEVYDKEEKPDGFKVASSVKNFRLLKKGSVVGYNTKTKEKIYSKESFYPILFGKNTYKDIFGFKGRKMHQ